MTQPNPYRAVAIAAGLFGADGLRAQGYRVDPETFDLAIRAVWALGDVAVTPIAADRNPADNGDMRLTATDVAQLADIGPAAVRRAAREDRLPGVMDDGRWRFDREDVDEWMANR